MPVYLVCHAKARLPASWDGPDAFRPLRPEGQRQAEALAAALGDRPIGRVVSSPTMRCLETVEPLAAGRDLELASDPRLADGSDTSGILEVIADEDDESLLLCSYGNQIEAALEAFAERGVRFTDERVAPEASVWELADLGEPGAHAHFHPPPAVETEPARRLAVLDLGSTSFQLVVYEVEGIERVDRRRVMLADGRLLIENGRVPATLAARAVEAARELAAFARESGAERVVAVGHSMLREAANGADLALSIGEAIDAPVELLDGEREAQLLFSAIRQRLELGGRAILGFDLGGAGLHVVVGNEESVQLQRTLPLGVARLRQEHAPDDPPTAEQASVLRERVWTELGPQLSAISRSRPSRCVATGGTVNALGRRVMATRRNRPANLHGLLLARSDLEGLERELLETTPEARSKLVGIDAARAHLLPAGAVILGAIADAVGLVGLTVCDWGVREGVALCSARTL